MIICWSPKGGSGTTVVAATIALLASREHPTALVDLDGDALAALGLPEHAGAGVTDWLRSSVADAAALGRLGVEAADGLRVVPPGAATVSTTDAGLWHRLAEAEHDGSARLVVDAGALWPPPGLDARALLVVRPCYLALRRAIATGLVPDGIVLVHEPGRALGATDVARALGAPVVAEVPFDPAIARAVDAGLLAARLPRAIAQPLTAAA